MNTCAACKAYVPATPSRSSTAGEGWCYLNPAPVHAHDKHWCLQFQAATAHTGAQVDAVFDRIDKEKTTPGRKPK